MSRRAGPIILLAAVMGAVVVTYLVRFGHRAPRARTMPAPRPHAAGSPLPLQARPAKVSHGRLAGGTPPAPAAFEVTISAIPVASVLETDVAPEDVPPLDKPATVSGLSRQAPPGKDEVLGVVVDGVARAYPLRLLNYHWVVHDVIDGRAVAVFWDPIAGAATAYQPTADGVKAQFGATGKVYQGSSLFYEAQTASLFLPITGRFVTGPRAGRVLRALPVVRDRWAGWLKRHRETRVLSADTGYRKPYDVDPFAAAALPPMLAGPGDPQQRLAPGEWVLGFVTPDRKAHCVALRDLPRSEKAKPVPVGEARVVRLPDGQARAALSGGGWPPQVICRYSAWYGAHPDTTVEAGDLSPAVRG